MCKFLTQPPAVNTSHHSVCVWVDRSIEYPMWRWDFGLAAVRVTSFSSSGFRILQNVRTSVWTRWINEGNRSRGNISIRVSQTTLSGAYQIGRSSSLCAAKCCVTDWLLFNEQGMLIASIRLFRREWSSWGVKLTTHLNLVWRLRMLRTVLPLPHASSWRGAELSDECIFMVWYVVKHRDNFTFALPFTCS
jgi:hypothetical protein